MSDALFSEDAIVRGLVAKGVPRAAAEREAKRQHAAAACWNTRNEILDDLSYIEVSTPIARPGITWPVRILLPWSYLVSDNDKFRARLITVKGQPKPINVITTEYANARDKIALLAKTKVDTAAPVATPLQLHARVWMPDARPHDMTNFCKLVHDALEGVVYENDRWLHDVHWIRAGVDVDAPRAEVTISPIIT